MAYARRHLRGAAAANKYGVTPMSYIRLKLGFRRSNSSFQQVTNPLELANLLKPGTLHLTTRSADSVVTMSDITSIP